MSLYVKFWNLRKRFRAVFHDGSRADDDVGAVLADLRAFCRADESCIVVGKDGRVDTHATAVAEGRREVFLRIMAQLNITDAQLNRLRELDDKQ